MKTEPPMIRSLTYAQFLTVLLYRNMMIMTRILTYRVCLQLPDWNVFVLFLSWMCKYISWCILNTSFIKSSSWLVIAMRDWPLRRSSLTHQHSLNTKLEVVIIEIWFKRQCTRVLALRDITSKSQITSRNFEPRCASSSALRPADTLKDRYYKLPISDL